MKDKRFPYAVLLRVGLDRDLGGIWGPITDDGELYEKREFEYIQFPESPSKARMRGRPQNELDKYGVRLWTYEDLPAAFGECVPD